MLEEILKKFSGYEIEPISVGIINHVIKLEDRRSNKTKMILKIYRDVGHHTKDKNFNKEIIGYEKASKLGIPIPKILEVDRNLFYILMENLEGITLREVLADNTVNTSTKYQLIEQLTHFLVKINSDEVQKEENGMNSYLSSFFFKIKNCISQIKDESLKDFVSNRFSLLYQKFFKFQNRFKNESFSFLHGDPHLSNIIVSKNLRKIKGIVDWERSHYGNKLEDLAKITKIDYSDFSDYILKKYCKNFSIDEEKLLFFKYLFALSYVVFFSAYFDEYNFQGNNGIKHHEKLLIKNVNVLRNFQL